MTELSQIDLRSLATGHKRTWDAFVLAASPLINAVVRRTPLFEDGDLPLHRLSRGRARYAGDPRRSD